MGNIYLFEYQKVHWTDIVREACCSHADTKQSADSGGDSKSRDTEFKRREAVWEVFKSELTFFLDHLMVLKHVRK